MRINYKSKTIISDEKEEPYEYQDELNEIQNFLSESFDSEKAKRLLIKYNGIKIKPIYISYRKISTGLKKSKRIKKTKKKQKVK